VGSNPTLSAIFLGEKLIDIQRVKIPTPNSTDGLTWYYGNLIVTGMASVRKHRKSKYWYACITLPDGRQKQFSTGLTDKAKAEVIAASAEIAARSHHDKPHQLQAALSRLALEYVPPRDADPGPWLLAWAESRKAECEGSTYRTYRNTMISAAEWLAENNVKSFTTLTGKHVTALRDLWAKKNSPGTANEKVKHLRIAFKDAMEAPHKVLAENPAENVALLTTRETDRRGFRMTEWEILLPALHGEWKAMVFLGLNTGGQRINDLAILKQGAVDVAAKTVTFFAQKTGALVCLPLMDATVAVLLELPATDNPDDFLFPTLAALAPSTRSNQFIKILAGVGLAPKRVKWKKGTPHKVGAKRTNPLSFHSLRHTATSWLKAAGVSDAIARAIVGHESKAVSQLYTHIDMETMRTALQKMPLQ
jgi:integrase